LENWTLDDPFCFSVFFCNHYCGNLHLLSNNPVEFYYKKPVYIHGIVNPFYWGFILFQTRRFRCGCQVHHAVISCIILISIAINFFSGNQNILFIDSYALKNGMVLLLEQLLVVLLE
jgi:hypothetical protein